jgi:hypothetical protein
MNLSVAPAQFTEGEALELTEYRPVNRFAVLSAIFGGLSVLAVLHPLLMALPLFGAATGFFAAYQLAKPTSLQSGNSAAKWGIFLSLLFGICATSANYSRQRLLDNQARTYAMQWFELLREGKLQEAHQLTMYQGQRAAAGTSLDAFYAEKSPEKTKSTESPSPEEMMAEPTPFELFENFYSRPLIKRFVDFGKNARYEYLQTTEQEQVSPSNYIIRQQYRVTPNGDANEQYLIEIKFDRTETNHIANWRLEDIREI